MAKPSSRLRRFIGETSLQWAVDIMPRIPDSLRALLVNLIDYAGLYPPAGLALPAVFGELRNVPGFAGELDAQPPGAARGEAAGSAFGGQLARDITGGGRTGPAARAGGDAGDQAAAQAFAADLL